MRAIREEDAGMKIPALLHLSRLGYAYTPRGELRREPEANLLPETLRAAVEKINRARLTEQAAEQLKSGLLEALHRPDLGQSFTRMLREGWKGLRLLDFEHPEGNILQAAAEVPCVQGKNRFQPDITIYVNGLPLVMIEVKTSKQKDGIPAEYDRMRRRFRDGKFRPFLQAAQMWIFSNDMENDKGDLLPKNGSFYAAAAAEEFPMYGYGETRTGVYRGIAALEREAENRILADQRMTEIRGTRTYRRRISPNTPAHRMLTSLLRPERLLFLIRYGIQYTEEADSEGKRRLRKRILTAEQLEALAAMKAKAERGYRNWTIPCAPSGGRTALAAAAVPLLREMIPGCRIYWVSGTRRESLRADADFQARGLPPGEIRFLSADRRMETDPGDRENGGERIFFLPAQGGDYDAGRSLRTAVRRLDPEAILITMGKEPPREGGGSFTYLLECADGSLYCGWTNDLAHRVRTHNAGRGARYTRARRPVKLVWWEEHDSREEAMSREWHIKQMTRAEKERLIRGKEEDSET